MGSFKNMMSSRIDERLADSLCYHSPQNENHSFQPFIDQPIENIIRKHLQLARKKEKELGGCSLKNRITASVNCSHPILTWELDFPASTVRLEFKSKTPFLAQLSRFPCLGIMKLGISFFNSWKILTREGGDRTPFFTEKHNPCAWFGKIYGSCPSITAFTLLNGVRLNA